MAADDAGRGARGINEDALERQSVPEGAGIAGVPGAETRRARKALEVLRDQLDPGGVEVDRRDLGALAQKLQQVTCLLYTSDAADE